MPATVSSAQVWNEIEKESFAVLGTVNPKGEPRTAGIVYAVKDRRLYIATGRSTWKAKNIQKNPHVSVTVTVDRKPVWLWWMKIPPAVVTFRGEGRLQDPGEVDPAIHKKLLSYLTLSEEALAEEAIIEVRPAGHFSTYGIGVSLRTMLRPEEAGGRVGV